MLLWSLVVLTIFAWIGVVVWYFKKELHQWLDNRYGPKSVEQKPPRQRRRMYD